MKEKHFSGQLLSFTVKDPCDQKFAKMKKETNKQERRKMIPIRDTKT